MGTKERREREKQEVRERILDAARELFVEEGYEAVTMRRIAKRIEYSPTAIYFHFQDKEALFRELCVCDFSALARDFQRVATIADPVERVRAIGIEYVRFGLQHPNHYRLMFMTRRPNVGDNPEADEMKGNPERDAYAFLVATLRECIAAERFLPQWTDAEELAQMLWAATHGVVALHVTVAEDAEDGWVEWRPAERTAERLIDAVLKGLLRETSKKGT
jgi:AcrR family transcriptional regulator